MTKILVIEDESILREEILEWLTFEDYDAIGAEDGAAGIEQAFLSPPDLIICDITMPRLDGYAVLLEIRANQITMGIPFIFMTARASHDDIRMGMASGADDYITKPFSRLELLQAVQARLEKKTAQIRAHQHETEQLQEALMHERAQRMLKARLVAMFSHDFRNPLAVILSSNSLLRSYGDRLDPHKRLSHMNSIEASVRQLLQMLDDMLVVAQMETDHFSLRPEPVDVEHFFHQLVDEFQVLHAETHEISFECQFDSIIRVDPRLWRQIAANLISNAIKYSARGSKIWVTVINRNSDCVLTVQDQGIGISRADQERLFEAFQRGSNVGNISGTGLGLAIVKQAASLLGGSIQLDSQPDVGTKISVTIYSP
jgi:signal transduction histidine kinase